MSLWIHKFELKPDCWVFVPSEESLQHGREIKKEIESTWVAPHYYSHLRPGGHVAALRSHIGNKLFIRADVNQFFNSINRTRVTRVLHSIFRDFNKARTAACTSVVTNPNSAKTGFILPFGFVQSPIIASLCLSKSSVFN